MKKEIFAILKSLLFIAVLVVVLDILIGVTFDSIIKKLPPEGERVSKSYYAFHKVNTDVVVVGSSRAETTYDCEILMDSLPGLTFYNCGGDGQGLLYCNTLINSIFDRYSPHCIVWDVSIAQIGGEDYENMSLIFPYYKENNYVKTIVDDLEGANFKYSILFNSYRYNATAARILRAYFLPNNDGSVLGFLPRKSADNSRTLVPKDFVIADDEPLNNKRLGYVSATLKRAQSVGCKIVIVVSPMYNDFNQDNKYARKWKEICDQYDAVFIDDSHLDGFVHNNKYAYDRVHVNYEGAEVFSRVFAHQLSSVLNEE